MDYKDLCPLVHWFPLLTVDASFSTSPAPSKGGQHNMRFLITLLSTLAAAASFVAASSPTATRSGELCARIDAPLTIFEGIKPVVIGQLGRYPSFVALNLLT